MGYDKGTLFVYKRKFWLFEGYSTNAEMFQTFKLRGVGGELIEALASECFFLVSPSEINYGELEGSKDAEDKE